LDGTRLCAALYIAALVASRINPAIAEFYRRLHGLEHHPNAAFTAGFLSFGGFAISVKRNDFGFAVLQRFSPALSSSSNWRRALMRSRMRPKIEILANMKQTKTQAR
jgi:hypothetical protein